jgi:hypothetical protein
VPAEINAVAWRATEAKEKPVPLNLLSVLPNRAARVQNTAFRNLIQDALTERCWDVIVYDYISMLANIPTVERALKGRAHRPVSVYLAHNHEETTGWVLARNYAGNPVMKFALALDAMKGARLERRGTRACDLVAAITDEDLSLFCRGHPQRRGVVLKPGYGGPKVWHRSLSGTSRVVVLLGSYQWIAKRQNLEEFLQTAAERFPSAGIALRVVGFMDPQYRRELSHRFPWAQIVGPVDDVSDELAAARIGIVAERTGGGFKFKVLNYVFSRLPVAALEDAMAGFPLVPERSYIGASDLTDLCTAVIANVDRTERLEQMAEEAFQTCEGVFDWNDCGLRFLEVLSTLRP